MKTSFYNGIKIIVISVLLSINCYAIDVRVTVSGLTFVPSNFSVNSGDNITFVVSNAHTASSTTIPIGATAFNFTNSTATITPTVAGVYNFQCNPHANSGMIGSFTMLGVGSTLTGSILELPFENEKITLYPSPAKDFIYFNFPKNITLDLYTICVADNAGKIILKNTNKLLNCKNNKGTKCTCESPNKIDISNLATNIYTLIIYSNNTVIYSSKFMKE